MRRLGTVSLVLVILALVGGPATAQIAKIEPMTIDFGKMEQREAREASIKVSNIGGGQLKIDQVRPDCGCTVAKVEKDVLMPGESTEINLTFDSKTFHGKTFKMVHVHTNDPDNPVIDISLVADIHAAMIVEPRTRRIAFQKSRVGSQLTMYAEITAPDLEELEASVDQTKNGLFKVSITPNVDGNANKVRLNVVKPADLPLGLHQDEVRVSTNIPESPYVDLTLIAQTGGALTCNEEKVNFRFQRKFRREIYITPFIGAEHPFRITSVEIDVPGVKAEILKGIPNRRGRVMLTGGPIAKDDPLAIAASGKIRGTLKIHTTSEDMPLIEIPVSYMVRM